MSATLVISLIGRPNVGKSTIFNRLLKKSTKALVHNRPGVTRDRHYGFMKFEADTEDLPDQEAIIIDTGGFFPEQVSEQDGTKIQKTANHFFNIMGDHARLAMEESDIVCFVVDIKEGLLPYDQMIVDLIRTKKKECWLLINKSDNTLFGGEESDFYELGFDPENMFVVSAAHGRGFDELNKRIERRVQEKTGLEMASMLQKGVLPRHPTIGKISLIGGPNVGKSTLLNRLIGEGRSLVSNVPGTTVDPISGFIDLQFTQESLARLIDADDDPFSAVEAMFDSGFRSVEIIDTAGIRKQSKVKEYIELQSVFRSLRSIADSDVVIMMIDAIKGPTHQDRRLLDIILEKGRSLIICINKVDLIEDQRKTKRQQKEWMEDIRYDLPWLHFCEIVPLSAKEGEGIKRLLEGLKQTLLARKTKVSTSKLNNFLSDLVGQYPLSISSHRHTFFKVKYASMVKTEPPTFLIFSNRSKDIPQNYRRFLVSRLRKRFDLINTPVHLVFRSNSNFD